MVDEVCIQYFLCWYTAILSMVGSCMFISHKDIIFDTFFFRSSILFWIRKWDMKDIMASKMFMK